MNDNIRDGLLMRPHVALAARWCSEAIDDDRGLWAAVGSCIALLCPCLAEGHGDQGGTKESGDQYLRVLCWSPK